MDLAKRTVKLVAAAVLAAASGMAMAGQIVYNFDTFDDGTALSSQYAGLTFTQSTVIKAGQSLNELGFPPRSGDGVAFDDGGPISIGFATPVFSVGGYFTYTAGLTVEFYDSSDNLLATRLGMYITNVGDGSGDAGSSANEFLEFISATGSISRVTVTSSSDGSSVTLDDLTVDTGANAVPAPSTVALMAGVLLFGLRRRGWLRRT